jgi:hypothetical protein
LFYLIENSLNNHVIIRHLLIQIRDRMLSLIVEIELLILCFFFDIGPWFFRWVLRSESSFLLLLHFNSLSIFFIFLFRLSFCSLLFLFLLCFDLAWMNMWSFIYQVWCICIRFHIL